jgi:hypothetical protein
MKSTEFNYTLATGAESTVAAMKADTKARSFLNICSLLNHKVDVVGPRPDAAIGDIAPAVAVRRCGVKAFKTLSRIAVFFAGMSVLRVLKGVTGNNHNIRKRNRESSGNGEARCGEAQCGEAWYGAPLSLVRPARHDQLLRRVVRSACWD